MPQYKNKNGKPMDPFTGARERTLATGLRKLSSDIYRHDVEQAFEKTGCSCNPYRAQLEKLEAEYKTEKKHLEEAYDKEVERLDNSELGKQVQELRDKIRELDRQEHPSLDAQARQAYYFLPVWLMDQVREGRYEILDKPKDEIPKAYVEAWLNGWRPRSVKAKNNNNGRG